MGGVNKEPKTISRQDLDRMFKDAEKKDRKLYIKKFLVPDIIDTLWWMLWNVHRALDYFFYQVYNTILFRGLRLTAFSLNSRSLYYRFLYYPYLTIRYKSPTQKNIRFDYTLGQGKRVHYQSKLPIDEPQRNTFFFWGKDVKPRKALSRQERKQRKKDAILKKKADKKYAIWKANRPAQLEELEQFNKDMDMEEKEAVLRRNSEKIRKRIEATMGNIITNKSEDDDE